MVAVRTKWFFLACMLMVIAVTWAGCGLRPQSTLVAGATPVGEVMLNAPKQPSRVVFLCLDSPPWYSPALFHKAVKGISQSAQRIATAARRILAGGLDSDVTGRVEAA